MKDRSTEALFAIRKALTAEDDDHDQVQEWLDRATELLLLLGMLLGLLLGLLRLYGGLLHGLLRRLSGNGNTNNSQERRNE